MNRCQAKRLFTDIYIKEAFIKDGPRKNMKQWHALTIEETKNVFAKQPKKF